jgi:hypothetical protein
MKIRQHFVSKMDMTASTAPTHDSSIELPTRFDTWRHRLSLLHWLDCVRFPPNFVLLTPEVGANWKIMMSNSDGPIPLDQGVEGWPDDNLSSSITVHVLHGANSAG